MPKTSFKPSRVVKKNLPSLGAWLTNAGKSIGVATMDVITETMPATAEMATSAAEFVQNFKSNFSDLKSQGGGLANALDLTYYKDLANMAKNNTLQDLKSGNLYHSANDIYDSDFGDDFDLDFGDDFDMGGDDDYDVDFNSEDGTTSVKTRHTQDGDTDINQVNVKVDVGNKSSLIKATETQTKAAVDYYGASIETTKQSTNAIIGTLTKTNEAIGGLLGSIDSNVSSLTTMVTTISQGTSVQMKYYEDSMSVFNNILTELTAIKQATTQNLMGAGQEQKEYTDVLDLFNGGSIDLSGYMNLVKKQFGSAVDRNFMLMSVKNILSDKDALKMAFAHPISNMVTSLVKQVLPAFMREAATEFDNTLRETMVSGLYQIHGLANSDNPILQFIGETFGINNKLKTNIDRANYKRGKVDWDGQSHKTLNEVIPYYLRKIASALTGEREVGFDYMTGTFKTVKSMRDEYEEDDNRRLTSGFSSIKSDFNDFIKNGGFVFSNTQGEKAAAEAMNKLLRSLVTGDTPIRRRKNKDTGEYSFLQDIADVVSGGDTDNDYTKLISAFFDTRQRSSVMETLGRTIQESKASFSKFKQREEAGEILTNSMYAKETGATVDPNFDKVTGKVLYNSKSPLLDKDKYGNTATYYLRNILELLASGIRTFPVRSKGGASGKPSPNMPNTATSILEKLSNQEASYRLDEESDTTAKYGKEKEREQLEEQRKNGKILVEKNGSGGDSYANFTNAASQYEDKRLEAERDKSDEKSFFTKITGLDSDKPITKIVNKFSEYIKKPSTVMTDIFKKADDFLFKLVFGGDLGIKGSIFKTSIDFVKKQFTTFATWMNDKVLTPIYDKFFGENGLFNQLKQTKIGQDISNFFDGMKTKMFGEKDANGNYSGGFFSEYANAMGEATGQIKESLIGDNPDSVWSNVKRMASGMAATTASLFGYDAEEAAKKKEETGKGLILRTVDDAWSGFKDRVSRWTDSVLGPDNPENTRRQIIESFGYDMKGKGAKIAAGSTLGAIGGLFSGVGPIGGAVGGLVTTIVGESETIKQILFGEMDLNTGERKGGLISKNIIDFFNDNGAGIKTGAVLGTAANLISGGSLGIFGPVVGAALGGAVQFTMNLDSVQRFLYGYDDKDGNHRDGFYDRMQRAFGTTDFKKLGIDAGIGAGVGVLGSFFLPGGPIVGALVGAGASITLQTEKFKSFFFGDEDPDTGIRSGGLLGKVTDAIMGPVKDTFYVAQVKFMGWLEQKVISPLGTAIAPILEEGRRALDRTKEAVVNIVKGIGNSVNDIVLKPIADTVKLVFAPIIDTSKKISDMTLKVIGGILTSPIKLLQMVGYGFNRKHMKEGQRDYFDQTIGNAFTFNKEKRRQRGLDENAGLGERLASFGKFFGGFFTGDFKNSKYGDAGANYSVEFNGKKLTAKQQNKEQQKESKAWQKYLLENKDKRFTKEDREKFDEENGLFTWWKKSTTAKGRGADSVNNMNVESSNMKVTATSVKLEGKLNDDISKALTYQGYKYYKKDAGEDALDRDEYTRIGRMFVANRRFAGKDVNIEDANRIIPKYKEYETAKHGSTAPKTFDDRKRERDSAYAKIVESAKKAGKTPISREEFDKKRDIRDAQKGIRYIDPLKVKKEDIVGTRAKGDESIDQTGAYILSKGEKVIPSGNKDDAKNEDKFFSKLKSRFSKDEKTAKRKETQDEELKKTQAKGSFETKEKLRKEKAEKEEQQTWRNKVLETVEKFKESATEHYNNWSGIFGKKGKIALAILALSPLIAKITGYIVDLVNGKGLLQTISDHVKSMFDSVGGWEGAFNRLKDKVEEFKELAFGKGSFLKRLENFIFPEDENGENQYTGRSEVILKRAGKTVGKYGKTLTDSMLKHQQAIRDQSDDYIEDARDSAIEGSLEKAFGKNSKKTWINRYDDVVNTVKNAPTNIKNAGTKAKDWAVNTKVGHKLFDKQENVALNMADFYNTDQFMSKVDDLGGLGFKQVASDGQTFKFTRGADGAITKAVNKVKGAVTGTKTAVKNSKIAKTAGKAKNGLGDLVKTKIPTKIDEITQGSGMLAKVTKMLQGAFDAIMKAVKSLINKFAKGKGSGKFMNKLTGFFGKIVKTLTSGKALSEFMSSVTAKIGLAASGIGLLTGLAGGTKANTANLFFVDEADVDVKMQAISLLWSELQNLPTWIPGAGQIGTATLIIDVVNEMVSEIMGIDFIREASTLIYGILSDDESTENLTNAQDKFEQQYNTEMNDLYTAYRKQQEAKGEEVLEFDNWRAEYGKSLNEYNDEKHKTIGHKIYDGIKGAGTKVANSKVGTVAKNVYDTVRTSHMGDVFTKDYWAVSSTNEDGSLKTDSEILKEKVTKALMSPITFVSGAVNSVIESLTGTVDIIKTTVKDFGQNTKNAFASISGGSSVFKPEYWQPPTTDDTTDLGNLSQIGFYLNRIIMFLPGLVFGVGKSIGKGFESLVDKVKKGATLIKDTNDLSKITSLKDVFNNDYWKAPQDPNNPMDAMHRAVFYGGRLLMLAPSAIVGLGKDLGHVFSPVIDPIVKTMGPLMSKIKNSVLDTDDDTPPDDGVGINRMLYYTAKLLGFVPKAVMKIGSIVGAVVDPIVKGVKTIVGSTFTGVEDLMQDPTRVFTKEFWTYDTADVGNAPAELGKMGMVLNVAGKLASFPIASTLATFKTIWNLISPVASTVGSVFSTTLSRTKNMLSKGILSKDSDGNWQSGLQGYFDSKGTAEGPLGTVQKVLNTVVGVVSLPAMLTVGTFGTMFKHMKPYGEMVKGTFGNFGFRLKNMLTKGLLSKDSDGNWQSGLQNYFAISNKQEGVVGNIQSVLSVINGITTLPIMLTAGSFGTIFKIVKPTVEIAKSIGGSFINRTKNMITKGFLSKDSDGNWQSGFQDYFSVSNKKDGVVGNIESVLTVVSGIATLPLMLSAGTFGTIKNLLTPVAKAIPSIVTSVGSGIVSRVKNMWNTGLITIEDGKIESGFSGYFDVQNNENGPLGVVQTILNAVTGVLTFAPTATIGLLGTIKNVLAPVVKSIPAIISGVGSGMSNRIKNMWEKGFVSLDNGKVQSGFSGFFDVPEKEEGPLGAVQTILSGIVGVMTFPVTGVIGAVGTVKNLVSNVFKGLKVIANNLKDVSTVDTKNTSLKEFFTMDTNQSDGDVTGIGTFVKIFSRLLYTPVFLYKKHIAPIVDGVKEFFSPVGDWIDEAFGAFQTKWNSFTDKFGWIIDKVRDFFGFGKSIEEIEAGNGTGDVRNYTSDEIRENGLKRLHTNGNGSGRRKKEILGGNGDTPDTENGFPYYSQNDPRIKDKPYRMSGGKPTDVIETMGNRGCGPTAMAMVASKIKGGQGNPYSPENMARIAEKGNYSTEYGTMPNYFTNVGSQLGMNVTPALATAGNIDTMLGNGQPVIIQGASDNPGSPFTSSGHYVVAVGKDRSGNVLVNDPRGKSYSGKYTMDQLTNGSARAWGFSNAGGFGGTISRGLKGGFGKLKKLFKNIRGGNGSSWIDVVRAVKQAVAAQKPGYSQTNFINITVGGRTIRVRTDCSGLVSACVDVYGNKSGYLTDSRGFTNKGNKVLLELGFTPLSWSGWDSLQEGDIIAKDGHVEIFSRNEGGRHYVYNAGATSSINNPGETGSSKPSYTTVWRAPGKSVDVNVGVTSASSDSSSSSGSITSFASAMTALSNEMLKPVQEYLFGTTDSGSTTSSGTTSSDYSNVNISGSDNAQKVWNFFTSLGYSKAATAGILGNMYAESGVNPEVIQGHGKGPAAGIVQWENWKTKSGRWKAMSDYAASKGKDWKDLQSQLEFIDKELHGLDYYFKTDVPYGKYPGSTLTNAGATPTTFEKWKQSTDVDMATRQFEGAFERGSKIVMDKRIGAAKSYYNLYAGGNGSGVIGGNGDMDIPYIGSREEEISPRYHRSKSERYTGGNGSSYKTMNQSLSRTEKLSQENSTYDDANVVAALGTVVTTLQDLLVEMKGTNEGVNKFNDKEIVVKNTPIVYNQSQTNIQGGNGSGEAPKKTTEKKSSSFIDENNYRIARNIASGGITFA